MSRPDTLASLMQGIGSLPSIMSGIIESGMSSYALLQQQWQAQLQKAGEVSKDYKADDLQKEAVRIWGETYDQAFRKFLKMPQLGLTRFHQEKVNHLNDRFAVFQTAMSEFIRQLCIPFEKSFTGMQDKLTDLANRGEMPEDNKIIYQMWIKELEGHYMTLFQSPEYIAALAKALDALESYTSARQDVTDGILKLLSMPTKKDMDSVYLELYGLKKRLRHLEKTIQQQDQSNG
jgi:class III poly(R)-hydroxyalkanoic acid synthase PhaE subunit